MVSPSPTWNGSGRRDVDVVKILLPPRNGLPDNFDLQAPLVRASVTYGTILGWPIRPNEYRGVVTSPNLILL